MQGESGSNWLARAAISLCRGRHTPWDTVGPAGDGGCSQVSGFPEQTETRQCTPSQVFVGQGLGEGSEALR